MIIKIMDAFDPIAGLYRVLNELRMFFGLIYFFFALNSIRFIHRTIEDEEHYRSYGVFPMMSERAANGPNNMNQPDHHIAPPPPPHLNYGYVNRENIITNPPPQSNQQSASFTQNSSMSLVSRRRRSFGMADNNNHEAIIPPKRPHMEDIRSTTVPAQTYNTQNNDTTRQCRFVEQNVGQAVNVPPPSTTVPNSVAQVQTPVTSVVIAEDVINIYRLYEEHNLLRRRVEINEERLQELRATNTYLLQQNEQLRRQTQCSCTNTIVNPVTLTTASQQSATPVSTHITLSHILRGRCFFF